MKCVLSHSPQPPAPKRASNLGRSFLTAHPPKKTTWSFKGTRICARKSIVPRSPGTHNFPWGRSRLPTPPPPPPPPLIVLSILTTSLELGSERVKGFGRLRFVRISFDFQDEQLRRLIPDPSSLTWLRGSG